MSITNRLSRLEQGAAHMKPTRERRIMELLGIAAARHKGLAVVGVKVLTEGELITLIGFASKAQYNEAVMQLARWWNNGGREVYGFGKAT